MPSYDCSRLFAFTACIFLFGPLSCMSGWTPKLLKPGEFLEYYTKGAALAYYVNIEQCHNQIYSNITQYSFGVVINNGYVTAYPSGKFLLTYSTDREVDGKHLNLTGPAIRSTGIALGEDPDVLVDMNDINPANGKIMDQSEVLCKNTGEVAGGFLLYAQTPKGTQVTTFTDVSFLLKSGQILYYVFDVYHCKPIISQDDKQFYAGKIIEYRFDKHGSLVFTDHLLSLGFITVYDVTMTSAEDVHINMYMYSRQDKSSTHIGNKTCTFGDTLKIFQQSI